MRFFALHCIHNKHHSTMCFQQLAMQSIMLNAAHAYEENKKSDDSIMNPIQQSLGSFLVKQIDPNEPQKTPRPQQDITPNTTTHALQEASTSKDGPSIDSTEKKNKEEQVELRIAWQYGKYLKNESLNGSGQQHGKRSSSSGKEWCHTFDLTKQGGKECLVKCAHAVSLVHSTESSLTEHHETETARAAEYVTENRFGCPLSSLVASIAQFIDKTRPLKSGAAAAHQTVALKPGNIGRIAVMSLGSFDWRDIAVYDTSNAMPVIQTLLKIKGLVREQRCLAIVSLPVSLFSDSDALRMQHVADSVLSFRAVQNDADIVKYDFCGCTMLLMLIDLVVPLHVYLIYSIGMCQQQQVGSRPFDCGWHSSSQETAFVGCYCSAITPNIDVFGEKQA